MQDYRCNVCEKLLFRMTGEAVVAVKCPRCKTLNTFKNAIEPPNHERPERLNQSKGRSHDNNSL